MQAMDVFPRQVAYKKRMVYLAKLILMRFLGYTPR